jgi:hypothetical protein
LLVRYGNREDVRRNLAANFSSEGWVGPSSLHYETKKKSMMEFRQAESDPNVRLWFDEFTESLGRAIERARVEEERDDF